MGKTIIIDEAKEAKLIANIFESAFIPKTELVKKVEKYLDDNFRRNMTPTLDKTNGHADFRKDVVMVKGGVDFETLEMPDLLRMLDDEFNDKIKDDDDRKKFLEQVITDWYYKRIKNGLLSVNHL